jgi:uncharacterized OsmC-like protein
MSEERPFKVDINQRKSFVFEANFNLENVAPFLMDEPEPVGGALGPNASKVLSAAVGNCLCASLLFCLQRSRVEVLGMKASIKGYMVRNTEGRWRIKELNVDISPEVLEDDSKKLEECIELFERFCIVSESVRQGIPINVNITR